MRSSAAPVFTFLWFAALSSPLFAQTPVNYKVAFIADSGSGQDFQNVLDMMVREGVDAVVHAGDLAYSSGGVTEWDNRITNTLGADFSYFASAGNHDTGDWDAYRAVLEPRMTANGITWPRHTMAPLSKSS